MRLASTDNRFRHALFLNLALHSNWRSCAMRGVKGEVVKTLHVKYYGPIMSDANALGTGIINNYHQLWCTF